MEQHNHFVLPVIGNVYDTFTNIEREIADFFLCNSERIEFSAKSVSKRLYVSEASLSRFAKKCGFKGFREFLFYYEKQLGSRDMNKLVRRVSDVYQSLLDQTIELINEGQMSRISGILSRSSRVYVYGIGSSGIAAREFKLRFMRLGLAIEDITDSHMMKINSALVNEDCLVIGISVSGRTMELLDALRLAKDKNAHTLLITANHKESFADHCDEILSLATVKNLEYGTLISPQFPILVVVDIFYSYFKNMDAVQKKAKHTDTIDALTEKRL